jgi:predicted RecA/RadA family phage recombinase
MKNFVQSGDVITVTAPGTIASGDLVRIGNLIGVAVGAAASGESVPIKTMGVFELPKVAGQQWGVGDLIYFDGAACTTDDTYTPLIGVAVADAAETATTGLVRLG